MVLWMSRMYLLITISLILKQGCFLPLSDTYDPQYIKEGTLTNTIKASTRKEPMTLRGQNVIYLDLFSKATVKSNVILSLLDSYEISLNIQAISDDSLLKVYVDSSATDITQNAVLLGEIDSEGVATFDIPSTINGYIYLVYEHTDFVDGNSNQAQVEIIDITVLDNTLEEMYYFEGYSLSQFTILNLDGQGGRYEAY